MNTQTLATPVADLVLVEVNPAWSRENVTLTGGLVEPLTVLARVGGKYKAIDFAGNGGAEKAAALGYDKVDATTADKKGVVLARGAVVDVAGLIWPAGATDVQKAAALTDLEARGIVARAAL